jgi:hypothetical protein
MANSIAYVTLGSVQGHPGGNDTAPEDVQQKGVWVNACYVTVSPGNNTGLSGSVVVPFNYGDDMDAVLEAITALVIEAVEKETKVAPRVRILASTS